MMLVYHDDATREYAYGPTSKVGTFPDALMGPGEEAGLGRHQHEEQLETDLRVRVDCGIRLSGQAINPRKSFASVLYSH